MTDISGVDHQLASLQKTQYLTMVGGGQSVEVSITDKPVDFLEVQINLGLCQFTEERNGELQVTDMVYRE